MSAMRSLVAPLPALLLLVATGCPASSESPGPEPTRAPPAAATAEPAADRDEAPLSPPAVAAPLLHAVAHDTLEARTLTLPGTTVALQLVPLSLRSSAGGAEEPSSRTLWVARTETTWDAYDVFVYGLDEPTGTLDGAGHGAAEDADAIVRPSQPYVLADYGFGHAGFPVICVSAAGAQDFCAWLSARTGRRCRLPTEAEWEAVCRAAHPDGGSTDGDAATALLAGAWLRDNAGRKSRAVGTRAPDVLGLHDLLGNVTEWCTTDADGPVARGGSWQDRALDVDCAARKLPTAAWNATDPQIPKSRWWLADANFAGFRVVCDDDP
jgi:formylglycine-generating enzyme required for sulfatase activity